MRKLYIVLLAAAGALLSGCKTEFMSDVPLSALQDPEVEELPALVRLEVTSCAHYEDSRQPSDSLVKAQEMMPRIFPSAEFSECYRQDMDSWAEFNINFAIDRDDDPEAFASEDSLNITTTPDLPLGIAVPPAVMKRIEQAQSAEMMMGKLRYAIYLNVINDSGEVFSPTVLSAWANGQPLTLNTVDIADGDTLTLSLSDVLIDRAIKTQEASVLIDFEALLEKREG